MTVTFDEAQIKTTLSALAHLSVFSADCFDRAGELARALGRHPDYLKELEELREELKSGVRRRPAYR